MLIAGNEFHRALDVDFVLGESGRFFPAFGAELFPQLCIEGVIEIGFYLDGAVVDMDGGKKERRVIASWKAESHRVKMLFTSLEFKYRKTIIAISRQFIPDFGR